MNNVIKKRKIILNKYIKTIIYWIISYTIRGKLWNEVMILPARIFVHRNQQKKRYDREALIRARKRYTREMRRVRATYIFTYWKLEEKNVLANNFKLVINQIMLCA